MKRRYQAADLFCGAGGTTTGAHASGYVQVKLAVNHWRPAVYSHQQNHPDVRRTFVGASPEEDRYVSRQSAIDAVFKTQRHCDVFESS